MKSILLLIFFTLIDICCWGQNFISRKNQSNDHQSKALIDSSSYDNWPIAESVYLSNNGRYISYFVGTQSKGCHTLMLQTNDGKWKKEFQGIENTMFTQDNKRAILSASDRIYIVKLGVGVADSVSDVISFKFPKNGNGEWIAYRQGSKGGSLFFEI